MADYNSKYSGEQVEALLDQVASGNAGGGGGGGIAVETDPIFSASPAATITEDDKAVWSGKQDAISDLATIRSGAAKGATAVQAETLAGYALEGYVDAEVKALGDSLAEVATSGSYSDLSDKPTFKTINNESIEGSGNITISGGSGQQGPQGDKGDKGDKGDTGVGVQSVTQTTTSNADGGSNVVTVTLTNGTKSTFTVKNGSKGSSGSNGTNGKDGADGATFTPSVDSAGNLSWTNNKGLTNPPTVNIKGPKGDAGSGGGSSGGVEGGIQWTMRSATAYIDDNGVIRLDPFVVYHSGYFGGDGTILFNGSDYYSEWRIIFYIDPGNSLTINVDFWANGIIPDISAGGVYELSVVLNGTSLLGVMTHFPI